MQDAIELARTFLGSILPPGAPGYDDARKVHNGLIDRRPALIARCRGMADIVGAVRFARARGLEISVRGGGHNVAGRAVVDAGLMIDLSPMKSVHVNAADRTAIVEGGATWKEFNREAQLHGLATTGGVIGSTGVAGLTLGGGIGWLMGRHGLALDNLVAVNLVLADGAIVRASAEEHPDLFWAVRGGGGNFGVAGSLEFRLHRVGPTVVGGRVAFPFGQARQVLRAFREMTATAPDELMMVAGLAAAPDATPIVLVAACHSGAEADGLAAMARIRGFGTVVLDELGPISYGALNGMLDDGFPAGAANYWKSAFLHALDDAAIETLVAAQEKCPVPTSAILVEHFHGAASRVPVEATAYALRDDGFNVLVVGQWMDPAAGDATTAWVRETYAAVQPFVGPRRYMNYLGADEDSTAAAAAAYGPNLARLRQLKTRYDPDNLFHLNVNILPG